MFKKLLSYIPLLTLMTTILLTGATLLYKQALIVNRLDNIEKSINEIKLIGNEAKLTSSRVEILWLERVGLMRSPEMLTPYGVQLLNSELKEAIKDVDDVFLEYRFNNVFKAQIDSIALDHNIDSGSLLFIAKIYNVIKTKK